MARIALAALAIALPMLAVVATGCSKKVGGGCKGTESSCLDKKTALSCRGEKYVSVACNGPAACSNFQDHANCDTSLASAGETCMGEDDEYACSPDAKRSLVCRGGHFEPYLECRGKSGCSMLGRMASCDTSIAAKGDACKTQGAVSCGDDQKHMVICQNGRFELYRYCRGQHGCIVQGDTPSCDETISMVGDPCGLPGQVVCSGDGKSELVCQGGTFAQSLTCKTACTVTNRPGRPIDCR
jgi:hypothetical protein